MDLTSGLLMLICGVVIRARPRRWPSRSRRCFPYRSSFSYHEIPFPATEVYMFGHLATDGRLRRVDQITRAVTTADA